MRLKGKTALISGAGRNNGKAIALRFAQEGADLILVAKQLGDRLNKVAKECESFGVKVMPVLADMGKHEEVNRVAKDALKQFGKVDVLVVATGLRPHKPFYEYDYDEWHQVYALNVHTTFYLAKALGPAMMERRAGSIVALGGLASLTATPRGAAHTSSKHGLYGLIKALAQDLGPYNVRANLLALSFIENERLNPEWYPETAGKYSDEQIASTPLRRTGTTTDAANATLFLASDESAFITGDRIICAGGRYM